MDAWADPDYIRDELEQRGEDTPRRQPHAGDPVWVYGDRRTVLAVTPDQVMTDDDAGMRLQLRRDRIWWDGLSWRTAA